MAKIKLSEISDRLRMETIDRTTKAYRVTINDWARVASEETKALVVETIGRGQSPVKSGRGQTGESARFTKYSPSYSRQIKDGRFDGLGKKLRPVNLHLTGTMLRSIKSRITGEGFSIWFTSPIAKYHTIMGAGRSQVKRKMLPVEPGDEFTRLIMKGIVDKFKSILSANLKKG